MQEHATDPGVFIRSMAARGHLGGMALAAPEAVRILDAAGHHRIIVETVGVGQSEVEVAAQADTTVVVLAPGWGDAVQMAKAGILEVADALVVNKAERDGAHETVRDLKQMIQMGAERAWTPPVLTTTAIDRMGIEEAWNAIDEHRTHLVSTGALQERRRARLRREVEALSAERFRARISGLLDRDADLSADLDARRIDPYRAAAILTEKAGGPARG
jgi:LAO/AO transport system kinase